MVDGASMCRRVEMLLKCLIRPKDLRSIWAFVTPDPRFFLQSGDG